MSRLDHDIHHCRALVVDGNPTSRSVLCAQLRDFGVGTVVQTGRGKDARQIIAHRQFDAKALYAPGVEARALPWARLGIARAQLASGGVGPARRTLDALIGEMPSHADSYDVLGRVLVEQGEMKQAFEIYQKAAELTPGSVTRLLHAGTLAFYAGQADEALKALERACVIGIASKMFDDHALVLLALLQFDAKDGKGLQRTHEHLARRLDRDPDCPRLRRFDAETVAIRHMHDK